MSSSLVRQISVHGRVFDVTVYTQANGREVVRVEGDELQDIMQVNEHLELKAAFHDELDRVRRRRAT